jgi:RND family efflux transporter MFP subunit
MHRATMALLSALLLSACKEDGVERQEPVRPVLSVIARADGVATLSAPGTIEPQIVTELGFRVLGRIIARNVSVGDFVKKGDVVAAIDPLALELAAKAAKADLSNAWAQQVNAASTEQRKRSLAQSKSGTEAALDQAEQALRTADASVARAKAKLDQAIEQMSYAQLRAEFDGVVTATSAEVGQTASAGRSIVTIARPDIREAVIDIPETSNGSLKEGLRFEILLQLDPSIRAQGSVREIAPVADAATRTRRVKITLLNPPAAFRLGSIVTALAILGSRPMITLPASAVLMKDVPHVWVVDVATAKVSLRKVVIEEPVPGAATVMITQGIQEGERVVIAGVHKLKDGQTVRIDERSSL